MTASLAAPPAPVPPCPHLTGAFAPVAAEVDIADLPVTGRLPDGLDGAYLRNGSNPRFPPIGSYVHPLDGDGMLHRVTISGGRARYDNRFVRTPMVRAEEAAGRALWPGVTSRYRPGADLVGPILAGTLRERPSAGVVRHGGRLLAVAGWTRPYRIGPALETLGPEAFGGVLPAGIGGHPKIDPVTGQLLGFSCHTEPPFLTWTAVEPDGTARPPAPVEGLDRPTLIHDMAITRRFLVLVVAPLHVDAAATRRGGRLLAWHPDDGTR
ncbi:MAG: carotenoid oxygenase family protein, partial [Pseudonocardia sp.]